MEKNRLILAFESSCDETCAAVVRVRGNEIEVLSNIISSQIEIHKLYGGVVPEIASRNHAMAILGVCQEALSAAGIKLTDVTEVAATTEPGLRGAVMVGQVFGEGLAAALKIPFRAINHLEAHISSIACKKLGEKIEVAKPPFVALLVSGGHTSLYRVQEWKKIQQITETVDDACGEAFDKVAKFLGLPYPGGVQIEKLAREYEESGGRDFIQFVKFAKSAGKKIFSFSGLKTAVVTHVNREKAAGRTINIAQIAASFQREAVAQLVAITLDALKKSHLKTLAVCGGVSANAYLRAALENAVSALGVRVIFPAMQFCTDNAAMVGVCAAVSTS
jgi:N6-L-threonylcarbamoyladenine synthase